MIYVHAVERAKTANSISIRNQYPQQNRSGGSLERPCHPSLDGKCDRSLCEEAALADQSLVFIRHRFDEFNNGASSFNGRLPEYLTYPLNGTPVKRVYNPMLRLLRSNFFKREVRGCKWRTSPVYEWRRKPEVLT